VGALATVMAPELERRQWEERKQKQAEFDRLNEQYERRKKAEFSGGAPDDEQVAEGAEYDAYLAMTATGSRVLESRQAGTLDPDAVAKSTQAERDKGHESPFKGGL